MVGNAASFFMAASGAASFDSTLIGNSVWFDGSADFLSRSGPLSSNNKYVGAFWFQKTSHHTGNQGFMMLGASGGANTTGAWMSGNNLYWTCNNTNVRSVGVFRDNVWYHMIQSWDLSQTDSSTAGSQGSKLKVFINGVEFTDYDQSYGGISSTTGTTFTSESNQIVGETAGGYMHGYMAQCVMLDGQSIQGDDVSVSDFLDTYTFGTNGSQFGPKANADIAALANTAGGNSFCLDFADSADYGKDISGLGKHLTVSGTMATSQQSTNTPSNAYATMDVLKLNGLDNSTLTIAEGNLRVTGASGSDGGWISTLPLSTSGTTEFQSTWNDGDGCVGICCYDNLVSTAGSSAYATPSNNVVAGAGGNYNASYMYQEDGRVRIGTSSGLSFLTQGDATSTNDVVTVRYNADDDEITFLINNVQQGSAVSTTAGLTYYAFCCRYNDYDITMHFEEGKFPHTIGSGNKTISSSNLSAPSNQGIDSFNAVKYTGNGTAIGSGGLGVTGTGFQPDFVWLKNRDQTDSHAWYDAIRGVTKQIESDTTAVQSTESEGLTAFGSDGFTVGNLNEVNTNTEDFIAWQWKGQNGTTSISDDSPPSLASTVSVSAANHFSIVSFTGNTTGSVQTIGHGLSGPPEMIIVKNLAQASSNWAIYHKANAATNYILFSSAATNANTNYFADTEPTTSAPFVFSVGTGTPDTNGNSQAMIAYCFRSIFGVCRVGHYFGNGNADGQYVQTGFRPKFVMAKWSTGGSLSGENWITKDTTRQPFNENNLKDLFPNANNVEAPGSTHGIDILANGFKMRGTGGANNVLNATYIYLAIADIAGNDTLPPIYGR